jgi:type IV pilus assembly protein PilA
MKKFIQQKLKNQKGMTLIELLAVIVIIAIIAAIAIPAIGNIIENSRVGAIKSDALNAIAAADLYYADNPTVTTNVTIVTLASGYLKDTASFKGDAAA